MWKYLFSLFSIVSAQHYLMIDQIDGIGYKYKYKKLGLYTSLCPSVQTDQSQNPSTPIYNFGITPVTGITIDLLSKESFTLFGGTEAIYSTRYNYIPNHRSYFEDTYEISIYSSLGFNFNINNNLNLIAKEVLHVNNFFLPKPMNDGVDLYLDFTPQFGLEYQF